MAKRIEGVYDKLIECAKQEFLSQGYQNASLRTIAQKAQTSTNSIYVRFKDKSGLFSAVVGRAVENFSKLYENSIYDFEENYHAIDYPDMFERTDTYIDNMVECIYSNYDEFRLLICSSEGTRYTDFINTIAEFEAAETERYIASIGSNAISSGKCSTALIHILSTSYISGLFEIVKHDMTKSEALEYSAQLKRFFRAGWSDIFSG